MATTTNVGQPAAPEMPRGPSGAEGGQRDQLVRILACAYMRVGAVKGWLLQGLEEAGVSWVTAYRVLEKAMEDIEDAVKLLEVKA